MFFLLQGGDNAGFHDSEALLAQPHELSDSTPSATITFANKEDDDEGHGEPVGDGANRGVAVTATSCTTYLHGPDLSQPSGYQMVR